MTEQKTEKLGLALSGGGFRASFYHIGVLAQMAEQGLLKHVEVISTVSGGSIIGALYYLHVKRLLESKPDKSINNQEGEYITDADYVKIVQDIEREFLKATQTNIRMQTFSDFSANWKMRSATYSRSDRLAELYDEHLYQPVLRAEGNKNPVQMQELKIYPDGNKNFIPWEGNKNRKAKVPILVLNATTLNTGRNWQFTAQKMGEPETEEEDVKNNIPPADRIDKKPIRLRRADSYANITAVKNKEGFSLQNLPLGHAVAASACVPGLFPPMSITGLYKDKKTNETITPQLVDGGVFDNQAIDGLLQNKCNCFVISDAAGQMGVENEVATGMIPVLLRVSSVLQDRVRTENLNRLFTVVANKNDIAFIDLRRGLAMRNIAWIDENDCQKPDVILSAYSDTFNVDVKVQEKLSAMRTDLDAFTEVEAYSLMLDGYRMTENELSDFKSKLKCSEKTGKTEWNFSQIAPWVEKPEQDEKDTDDYLYQLEVASMVPFKALRLMPIKIGVPLALTVFILLYLGHSQITTFLFHQFTVFALVVAIVGWVVDKNASNLLKSFEFLNVLIPQSQFTKTIVQVAGMLLGTFYFRFYLWVINPMFLNRGSLETLRKKSPRP